MRYPSKFRIFSLLFSSILFLNCAPVHQNANNNGSGQSSELASPESQAIFQSTLFPILQNNCAQCHGVNQQPMFAVADPTISQNTLLNSALVNLQSPVDSRIVQKVLEGHQNFSNALATEIEAAIDNWATQLQASSPGGSPIPAPPILEATFSSIQALILIPKCVGCHSPGGERPQEDYSTYQSTMNTGGIAPGEPNNSEMFRECESGSMPENAPPLSNQEMLALEGWILMGAPNN